MTYSKTDYEKAVQMIRERTALRPTIGLVLGSGLGTLANTLEDRVVIPYADIPGWPQATVAGHSGQLVLGRLEEKTIIAQQGRAHYYEGYTMEQVTFPIRVMHFLGVHTLIVTNAAGGLNKTFRAGDVMLIKDHINLAGIAGHNPLRGANDETIGPRFPGMVHTYDKELREIAHEVAETEGITLREGIYAYVGGPSFETPAEIRLLRMLGGDAVGMSTVHEAIVARHAGMRVLACSGISNMTIDTTTDSGETDHEEVLAAGRIIVPKLTTIAKGVLRAIP